MTQANGGDRVDPAVVAEYDAAEYERDVAAARRALERKQEGAAARLEQALSRFPGTWSTTTGFNTSTWTRCCSSAPP